MSFRFNWKITVFSAAFAGLFIYLGLWQLERADEKGRLLSDMKQRHYQEGVPLSDLPEDEHKLAGQPVTITGTYDAEHLFLLDNRIMAGKVGFEVLVPFDVPGRDTTVLVNRGFVPMGRTRAETPEIPPVSKGEQTVRGHVYVSEENPLVDESDGTLVGEPPWPIIVQVADPTMLQVELDRTLFPYTIRLSKDDPAALPRDWRVTTISPHRHWGYAIQWFLMALVALVAWLAFSVKAGNDQGH